MAEPQIDVWDGTNERRQAANAEEREKFGKHLRVVQRALELQRKKEMEQPPPQTEKPKNNSSLLDW